MPHCKVTAASSVSWFSNPPSTALLSSNASSIGRTLNLKYTALSYTWGNPLATTPILVNGVETEVTLNLEAALRHIRKPEYDVILWVDALCINQNDVAEKNHQVEMMREIFAGAELVIAWLGSASGDSDLAMEVLGKGLLALVESERKQRESAEHEGPGHPGNLMINNEHRDSEPVGFDEATFPPPQLKVLPLWSM